IENLRVRYFADQQSNGYAVGADFAVSSEFVPGLESTFRLSLMKTAEDIEGDSYTAKDVNGNTTTIQPGYLKRPTDQRINFSAFFQDELFNNPSYKVHLTLLYGSSLPVGPPETQRYQDNFKIPAYKRVDIGFSKDFLEGRTKVKLKPLSRFFDSFIAYAEVFNLLNINNTVSFLWIKDVNNNQFAIPNYLTSRQLNIKFIAKMKN
ncbi:MAG: TonB-dependent receptor, partial [Sphingobacteriaceae bacterium]